MSLHLAKKQEEANQKKVRNLLRLNENKKCFDCPNKSPAFVNTTIQTFVCARCSGLVREVGHRVRSITAGKFTGPEALALELGGNAVAQKIWLSNYSTHQLPEPESDDAVRLFIRQKYHETKWFNGSLWHLHNEKVKAMTANLFTTDGLPLVTRNNGSLMSGFARLSFSRKSSTIEDDDPLQESSVLKRDDDFMLPHQITLPQCNTFDYCRDQLTSTNHVWQPVNLNLVSSRSDQIISKARVPLMVDIEKANKVNIAHRPLSSTSSQHNIPISDSIMSDLAGLQLETTINKPMYSGGILSPSSFTSFESSSTKDEGILPRMEIASKPQKETNDPYAALREIAAVMPAIASSTKEEKSEDEEEEEEEDWQDFCSPSQEDFDTPLTTPGLITKDPDTSTKVIAVDLFSDLNPRYMFK